MKIILAALLSSWCGCALARKNDPVEPFSTN
jgi:hypothetical protein